MSQEDKEKRPHVINYTVNDEPQSTTERVLTPTKIMVQAKIDPKTNYLVELRGHQKISYEGKPDEEIKMHEGMKFITVFTGETPVS